MLPPPELRAAVRARVLARAASGEAQAAAREVAALGGPAVLGVLFFGSRKTRARPDSFSAYDLFVITTRGRPFYDALHAKGALKRSPSVLASLGAVLPPNVLALRFPGPDGALVAKCAVLSLADLQRETSARRKDHFCLGRLFQQTEILYVAEGQEDAIMDALLSAHVLTWDWGRAGLPPAFDVAVYCQTLLQVSFAAEIRPEPEGRAEALWRAQQDYLRPVYGTLLDGLVQAGELRAVGGDSFAAAREVTRGERLRLRAYFQWSLVRATARWAKYVVTFDGWLDFIVKKARRHTGDDIVLTERERRLPLVFLWPRLIQYLRHKDRPRG